MFGDVNISAILDSFSSSYDKRVRPNYGGECDKEKIYIYYFIRMRTQFARETNNSYYIIHKKCTGYYKTKYISSEPPVTMYDVTT